MDISKLVEPCPVCSHFLKLVQQINRELTSSNRTVTFVAADRQSKSIQVDVFELHCDNCKNSREVPTVEGRDLIDMLARHMPIAAQKKSEVPL